MKDEQIDGQMNSCDTIKQKKINNQASKVEEGD